MHLAIAFGGAYWLARRANATPAGATLAALTYAFGGMSLSLLSNVVFLVGAAWLPWALGCLLMVGMGNRVYLIGASACCAMMILGGDPQQVLHVGLIGVLCCFWRFIPQSKDAVLPICNGSSNDGSAADSMTELSAIKQARDTASIETKQHSIHNRSWRWKLVELGILVVFTAVLAAAQLLPTWDWAGRSERVGAQTLLRVIMTSLQANNVSQAAESNESRRLQDAQIQNSVRPMGIDDHAPWRGIFAPPIMGSVDDHIYQFSLPPWSIAEVLWPNASGKMFPIHRRWSEGLAGADRVWYPSIYFGIVTIWMAIGGLQFRKSNVAGWLTYVGLFFALAACGWYGPVWLANELLPADRQIAGIGPQVGGIYWMLMNLVPGYDLFRYPAKLCVVANLCFSVLAGIYFTQGIESGRVKNRILFPLLYSVVTGLFASSLALGLFDQVWNSVPPDHYWGPFDRRGAWFDLNLALLQGTVVVWAFWLIWKLKRKWMIQAILSLVAIDLAVANRWIVADVPSSCFSETMASPFGLERGEEFAPLTESERNRSGSKSRNSESNGSESDGAESEDSEFEDSEVRDLGANNSAALITIFRPRERIGEPTDWMISSSADRMAEVIRWQRQTLYPKHHWGQTIDNRSVRLIGSFSSIWPAFYEQILAGMEHQSDQYNQKNQESNLLILDWPVVEFLPNKQNQVDTISAMQASICQIEKLTGNQVVLSLNTEQAGILKFNSIFEGNWWAEVNVVSGDRWPKHIDGSTSHRIIPLEPSDNGLQQLPLPAGDYRIRLFYWPRFFWWGLGISGAGWSLLILFGTIWWVWPRVKRRVQKLQKVSK